MQQGGQYGFGSWGSGWMDGWVEYPPFMKETGVCIPLMSTFFLSVATVFP